VTHIRKQVRDATVTLLSGATDAGTRVYASRSRPLETSNLPAIRVFCRGDQFVEWESIASGDAAFWRDVTLVIEVVDRATSLVEDAIDTVAEQVETAMAANKTLSLTGVLHHEYQATDISFDTDGEQDHAVAAITYTVHATP